jgi:hypothetical protein
MVCGYYSRYIQRPVADRIIFQGDKTESENKTVLWEFRERGADPNMDSIDSVSAFYLLKAQSKKGALSFTNFISVIRTMLFQRINLTGWLIDPSPPLKKPDKTYFGQPEFVW